VNSYIDSEVKMKIFICISLMIFLSVGLLFPKEKRSVNYYGGRIEFLSSQNQMQKKGPQKTNWRPFYQIQNQDESIEFNIDSSLTNPTREYFPFERNPSISWDISGWYYKIEVGDINNDGWDDIVIVGNETKILI